jgi:phosphopantetheine adenylyltransferase/nicotinamide mononucleotide (NMN) deamidase PncC
MSMAAIFPVVERIHASPFKFNIITTGAGGSAIAALMSVPGCSRTLINAQVPYATKTTQAILDHAPSKFVSPDIGRQLAQHAYRQAVIMDPSTAPTNIVGIGATAAIQTATIRRGVDAVFVSAWGKSFVRNYALEMSKELSRAQQEEIVGQVILRAMADTASVSADEIIAQLEEARLTEPIRISETIDFPSPISAVLSGQVQCALFNHHGDVRLSLAPYGNEDYDYESNVYLLYPGSFKPLHWGHTELARVGGLVMQRYYPEKKNVVITYEISASIVGKADVCEEDFIERISQFTTQGRRVAITAVKLFVEKAEMFPNHGLVVGIDTARRVLDKQYYENDDQKMIKAMRAIDHFGCYFVVGGRKHGDSWDDLSNLAVPVEVQHMFKGINPADFRVDISSTEIRARRMSTDNLCE